LILSCLMQRLPDYGVRYSLLNTHLLGSRKERLDAASGTSTE
jgi:hypothetical protein